MKRKLTALILLVLTILLSACSESGVQDGPLPTPITIPTQAPKMSQEQYDRAVEDLNTFVEKVMAFSGEVVAVLNMGSDSFLIEIKDEAIINLSLVSRYVEAKEKLVQAVENIREYDSSELSGELQKCFDKLLEYAEKMEYYSNEFSKNLTIDEFEKLLSIADDQVAYIEELGELLIEAGTAMDAQIDEENADRFFNKFGTPSTLCAHAGCKNVIAYSGDTNCCVEHSNKCLNCGKYIDEDAMYCMDCLRESAGRTSNGAKK